MMRVFHEFPAYYQRDSKILILGSMPSLKSREYGFYYMHPQNRFWKVLACVFAEDLPSTMEQKQLFLKRHRIALWDVIASCEIQGSSDASIKHIEVNPIEQLLEKTEIEFIYVTGKKALQLYEKYCYPRTNKKAIYLPSTSPANIANFNFEELVYAYQQIKEVK